MAATINYGPKPGERVWTWDDLEDVPELAPYMAEILAAKARIGGNANVFAQRIAREFFLT